ncbi:cytochrome c1 [Fluoribacter gormanii]|nr:cytochrome c1 [Fluoribacter gormanii]MCW8444933.1 cytochrome c1 [Fluoribacter gormanii]
MMRMQGVIFYLAVWFGCVVLNPVGWTYPVTIDVQDQASLQRGARLFMNYCSGCHSLKYLRYNHMAKGLGLIGFDGQINQDLLKNNLIFTQATINDPIRIALPPEDAKQWFGIVPPDLSLIAREKGTKWLYSYLSAFYKDDSRPFGTNNHLVPDVAMPNILETLNHDLSREQFDSNLQDLVTFLAYVGEPVKLLRHYLGFFVVGFLLILFLAAWGLKTIYWRKIGVK